MAEWQYSNKDCYHDFTYKGDVKILDEAKSEIVWDIFYCKRCLVHVRKERQCPKDITTVIENE